MKELLTSGTNGETHKFFIMGNHGQVEGTPYFDKLKDCMIEIFRMCQNDKHYTNIYDMSQREYNESFGR